jgi:hypothetical protein
MNIKIQSMAIQGDNMQFFATRQNNELVLEVMIQKNTPVLEVKRVNISDQDGLMKNARLIQQIVDGEFNAAATAEIAKALLSMTD